MSLSKDRIVKNTKKYFETGQQYNFMPEKLITFLGANLVSAPASTLKSLHNAFEGGLIDHMLRVTKYAVSLNEALPEPLRVDKTSLVKVCCLHQIGKTFLYNECKSQWHRDNQGKMYEFNEELISMRVGERSVYYALSNGVSLTEEEYQALLNYDKAEDDKQSRWHTTPLGSLLKMANELAIMEEKNLDKPADNGKE